MAAAAAATHIDAATRIDLLRLRASAAASLPSWTGPVRPVAEAALTRDDETIEDDARGRKDEPSRAPDEPAGGSPGVIRGLGVDLVAVSRMRALLERHGERALRRLFTEAERRGGRGENRPGEYYAARFAAKEALLKAVGTGKSDGLRWREIEVRREHGGNPRLETRGEARRRLEATGADRTHLSLSHEGGQAVAVVILEG